MLLRTCLHTLVTADTLLCTRLQKSLTVDIFFFKDFLGGANRHVDRHPHFFLTRGQTFFGPLKTRFAQLFFKNEEQNSD